MASKRGVGRKAAIQSCYWGVVQAAVGLQELQLQKQERGRHRSRSLELFTNKLQQAWGINGGIATTTRF